MPLKGVQDAASRPWTVGCAGVTAALDWLVRPKLFGRFSFRQDCAWTPCSLVKATLLWAWGEETALTDRYATAQLTIAQQAIASQQNRQQESVSYQAFLKLLKRHTAVLLFAMVQALQQHIERWFPQAHRMCVNQDGSV